MSDPEQYHDSKGTSTLKRNPSAVSQYTNASGIADSTISYGESLRLSQFPPPPSSIPVTPVQHNFASNSSSLRTAINIPLAPLRRIPHDTAGSSAFVAPTARWEPVAESSSPLSMHVSGLRKAPSTGASSSVSQTLSPHDWHEGASSIDVDAAEDRLLPTSFITSLLQESANSRTDRRSSFGSDAISGISEMTYPPLLSYAEATRSDSTTSRYLSYRSPQARPTGGRPPPSSFAPIPEHERRLSGDSETIYDHGSSIIKTANGTRDVQASSTSIAGMAPAKLHSTSPGSWHSSRQDSVCDKEDSFSRTTGNDSITQYKELHKVTPYVMHVENEAPVWLSNTQPRILQPVRNSVYSAKSSAPSIFSRISSNKSIRRAFTWRRKPLPPVPIIPHISIATEMEHRRADEDTPLPELVNRAGALHGLLEKGHHPHHSINSQYPAPQLSSGFDDADTMAAARSIETDGLQKAYQYPIQEKQKRRNSFTRWIVSSWRHNRRWFLSVVLLVLAVLGAIIAVIVVFVNRGRHQQVICSNGLVGANCNLNATCVCTGSPGICNPLAQNIVDLVPSLNKLFMTNETTATVYSAIWASLGAQTGDNCASQSVFVDTSSALNPHIFPNRTNWVQTALLWNLFQSQDQERASQLQKFVSRLPWHELDGSDGPVPTTQSSFTTQTRGYEFNFAAQTVLPPSASFIHDGQPVNDQISRVSSDAQSVLDQMYSYAIASSQQTELALASYWTNVLKQNPKDLSTFKSALSVSPVLLPFDGSSSSIRNLYTNSTPNSFPPPLACYPNLNDGQRRQIESIETGVFGLGRVSNSTQFDSQCYPPRPVYGVIDILRLRLPFLSARHGVAKQAAVLTKAAQPRVVISAGEALSALPGSEDNITLTNAQLDPRNYGTFGNINHVLIQYFSSITRTDVAIALVEFVLNSVASAQPVPPSSSSQLFEFLDLIPALEVAVFGTIAASDIAGTYSSFTTPNDSLFFGSQDGAVMRNWTITQVQQGVVWAENVTSPVVIHDLTLSDAVFNATWNASATAIAHSLPNVGVSNITTSFSNTGKFSP